MLVNEFQSLTGRLKTIALLDGALHRALFQSLTGRLKTVGEVIGGGAVGGFQSLTGRLKTTHTQRKTQPRKHVSIPHR